MKIELKKKFVYFHNGFRAVEYGPGIVDVSDEVAIAAKASGALEENAKGVDDAVEDVVKQDTVVDEVVKETVKEPVKQTRNRK